MLKKALYIITALTAFMLFKGGLSSGNDRFNEMHSQAHQHYAHHHLSFHALYFECINETEDSQDEETGSLPLFGGDNGFLNNIERSGLAASSFKDWNSGHHLYGGVSIYKALGNFRI